MNLANSEIYFGSWLPPIKHTQDIPELAKIRLFKELSLSSWPMLSQRYFEWQEGHFMGHPDISMQRDISSGTSLKPIIVST